ncbi:MAG TPA: 16S rRNA (cytosine(1402)-N(4))-methyltransferase, partial [Pyrinomonadaceae bacterium]|nr:16S rRNA (cytosine(1402)-N(4))-methyltransferase [Pyrinomonadaceae bacterium]
MSKAEEVHKPVLRDEVVELLGLHDGSVILDATLGLGGHSEAILERNPTAMVVGIDQDENA